jgi:ketosteroid isomerase-like protein
MLMRIAALVLAFSVCACAADQNDKKEVISVVNQLFAGMAAGDAAAVTAIMTPDAKLISAREDKVSPATSVADFAKRISTGPNRVMERMWNPTVLVRGRIAMLWADYDVYVGGKFNHCGIDGFTLLKMDAGWKISEVIYTSETENCKPSPLGPPKP